MAGDSAGKGKRAADSRSHFLAGACSGILVGVALQPLDVIRTHLQAPTDHGGRRTVVSIVRELGLRGLWRGTAPTALRIGLGAGLYFSLLESVMRTLRTLPGVEAAASRRGGGGGGELPAGATLAAGAATRTTCAVLLCPLTVVKTRMEYTGTGGSGRSGTLAALSAIARTEGLRGLFSGLGPTIVRDAPYSGLYLLIYTRLRTRLHEHILPTGSPQRYANLLAGGCAGAVSTLVTHPADVVRTRLQLEGSSPKSVAAVVRQVYQAQGLSGFFAGAIPRMGKRALQQALQWLTCRTSYRSRLTGLPAVLLPLALKDDLRGDAEPHWEQQPLGRCPRRL